MDIEAEYNVIYGPSSQVFCMFEVLRFLDLFILCQCIFLACILLNTKTGTIYSFKNDISSTQANK